MINVHLYFKVLIFIFSTLAICENLEIRNKEYTFILLKDVNKPYEHSNYKAKYRVTGITGKKSHGDYRWNDYRLGCGKFEVHTCHFQIILEAEDGSKHYLNLGFGEYENDFETAKKFFTEHSGPYQILFDGEPVNYEDRKNPDREVSGTDNHLLMKISFPGSKNPPVHFDEYLEEYSTPMFKRNLPRYGFFWSWD